MAFRSRSFGTSLRICVALTALLGLFTTNVMPSLAAGGQTGNPQGGVVESATRAPVAGAAITGGSPSAQGRGCIGGRAFLSGGLECAEKNAVGQSRGTLGAGQSTHIDMDEGTA